jgi:hypothetical protein
VRFQVLDDGRGDLVLVILGQRPAQPAAEPEPLPEFSDL